MNLQDINEPFDWLEKARPKLYDMKMKLENSSKIGEDVYKRLEQILSLRRNTERSPAIAQFIVKFRTDVTKAIRVGYEQRNKLVSRIESKSNVAPIVQNDVKVAIVVDMAERLLAISKRLVIMTTFDFFESTGDINSRKLASIKGPIYYALKSLLSFMLLLLY